ncbi:hypothetical protein [uncultured Planococcus sp.]|uniref:hypothetical protein n=1 Tax=uncultured Planococcus sp. TaxID=337815 RepID=UPI002630D1D3|nr:hypothetical protein [uncultured Planococcus sp.]
MDFKSKIIKTVIAAEAEINRLISNYEATIKNQQKEIAELQKYKNQKEEIEKQQKEINELKEKLNLSETERLLLQGRLDLEVSKNNKQSSFKTKVDAKPLASSSLNLNKDGIEENEWEKTLMQVRNDLKAATEKKKREKSYYENSTYPIPSAITDLATLNDSLKPSIYRYKVNVVDRSNLEQFISKYNLVEREAILPLYETKHSREIYLYTEVETIFVDLLNKEIYMVNEEFEKLLKRYSPLVIKYRQFSNIIHNDLKKKNVEKANVQSNSDDVKQPSLYAPTKDTLFSEQSELNKMGYRISGSTRGERWKVLERAVPELGLRKVVTIISANIRIRKRQLSDEQKYQHAITEWEYDLNRLNEKYYRGEFKWPKT